MAAKITFGALVEMIQAGTITKAQISEYFEIDAGKVTGFAPVFRVRSDTVDGHGVERTAYQAGHQLALDAERVVQLRRERTLKATFPYAIIAVGDSWFSHPTNTSVIDVLQDAGYSIHNMAHAGETLEDMIIRKEYMRDLSGHSVTHFLFSGGGNDVVGRLNECINLYNMSYLDPDNPNDVDYYVKAIFFDSILSQVKDNYRELLSDVQRVSPSTKLLVHGYANARPTAHGPFLGDKFHSRGFELTIDERKAMTWRIVTKLVELFNIFLKSLASHSTLTVQYSDFRPVVRQKLGPVGDRKFGVDKDWYDYELHPSRRAAKKMADVYKALIPAPLAAVA